MIRVGKNFWSVLVVIILGWVGLSWTHSVSFSRLLYLFIFLLVSAFIMSIFSLRKLKVKRLTRGSRQQVGQIFEELFEINNISKFSRLWLEVEDATRSNNSGGSRIISSLRGKTSRTFSSYVLLTQRGQFNFGSTILKSGDPFGLFTYQQNYKSENQNLIVFPYLVDLQNFPSPTGQFPGGVSIQRRTPEKTPPQVAGVRDYAPGDSLSKIHWRTTARRNRWMVKEFEQDPQADTWVFLDADRNIQHQKENEKDENSLDLFQLWWLRKVEYHLPQSTIEYSISIAGSIAKYLTRTGQIVGFVTAGKQPVVLPAEKGERQLNKILQALAFLRGDGKLPLNALIEAQIPRIPKGSMIIIISATVQPGIAHTIAKLIRMEMKPVLILIDPVSFGGLSSNAKLISDLQKARIILKNIKFGDDIKQVLEN